MRKLVLAGVAGGVLIGALLPPVDAVAGSVAGLRADSSSPSPGGPVVALTPAPAATPLLTSTATPIVTTPSPTITPSASVTPTLVPTLVPTTTPGGGNGNLAQLIVPASAALPGRAPDLPLPAKGRARVMVAGLGTMGYSGTTSLSVPIASVTKVMTADVVLRDHPLAVGEPGPTITVKPSEAKAYTARRKAGESVVKVVAGEKLTELQALQGMLISSGNNMADLLARWDVARTPFLERMNATAATLGMTATHFVDVDGLSPKSRSSAIDLLKLAPNAMLDPTFAQIVSETSARIPHVTLRTTDSLLGRDGVIGIKTGSTKAAGGCLLFAARKTVSGRVLTIYGVVLGAPGPLILTNALKESGKLVVAAENSLRTGTLVRAGTPVASLVQADGSTVQYAPSEDLKVPGWGGGGLRYRVGLSAQLQPGEVPTALYATSPGFFQPSGGYVQVSVPLVPLTTG